MLKAKGIANVEAVTFDINEPKHHQDVLRHLEGRYGKLDILVNNAGVLLDPGDFASVTGYNTTSTVTPGILKAPSKLISLPSSH